MPNVQSASKTFADAGPALEPGVSRALAQWRAARIEDVAYDLAFSIPASANEPIAGQAVVRFSLKAQVDDLQLDFRDRADRLHRLTVNGIETPVRHKEEHLIVPGELLHKGANTLEISFTAGDSSLNRNPDFLYTLFVPDRARTAFPVFDQPDLKSRYRLRLEVPEGWEVLAPAPVELSATYNGRTTYDFAQSEPLSSYLFSFAAGRFQRETRLVGGRQMSMLYRETDEARIARNMDAIFTLHGEALAWLEEYTAIPYPFAKFDFVAIPAFQYGGMEHTGAIQYRAESLFLDEDPSQPDLLARASLIAHETAHMWFGNLVTMRWFDDVWTKEVFANLFAAKIVNPSFPDVDHDLNFLLDHYPSAYAIDRTEGANPIRQPLANLDQAGSLYGNIIYDKAPIMMRQLELMVGERAFRDGMREYLRTFARGNATWPELIAILDRRTNDDLAQWSDVWVNTPGRPHYVRSDAGALIQQDPAGKGRKWQQEFGIKPGIPGKPVDAPSTEAGLSGPVLFNADGKGYGLFPVDPALVDQLWNGLSDLQKGAQLVGLYEQMLEGHPHVSPGAHFAFLFERALGESNELLLAEALGQMARIYWTLLTPEERMQRAPAVESALFALIDRDELPASTRRLVLGSLQGLAVTPPALERLRGIWSGAEDLAGITLSEREQIALAASLAVKRPVWAAEIVELQRARITNPDEQRRFAYLAPVLSADPAEHDRFFASLADARNRATENWVLDALAYLHHPLRTDRSQTYVLRSLDWLEDIQQTGDIFFPAGWIGATLRNHTDPAVAAMVRQFLESRPDYNEQLRLKILQAADPLFRATRLRAQP